MKPFLNIDISSLETRQLPQKKKERGHLNLYRMVNSRTQSSQLVDQSNFGKKVAERSEAKGAKRSFSSNNL